jgi:TRAP-type C4-dicarboxylate transport system permease small subunit
MPFMLHRFCDRVAFVMRGLMWIAFAALIGTVALQVLARDLLQAPMIWTGDMAQLLFAWLIFVGAAVGLREGAHYVVDLLPRDRPAVQTATDAISLAAGFLVAFILLRFGWELASIRSTGSIQSLGISGFWMFLPLPVSGAVMILFLVDMAAGSFSRRTA